MSEDKPTDVANLPELPRGWTWTPFLETCESLSDGGRKIQQKHYLKAGKYEVVDQGEDEIGGYTDDANQLFTDPLPVIVFGDHTRRFKLITRPFAVGADGVKLIGSGPAWNAKCLYFFLRALKFEDRGYSRHFQFVRSAHLPLPPLAEQARISDALDELLSDLDAGVEALQRAQAKLALYRASVLKAAVQGDLTAEWRKQHPDAEPAAVLLQRILTERRQRWEQEQLRKFKAAGKTPPANWKAKYKEPVAPDTTNLPQLPEGWCWASLDQMCLQITDGEHIQPRYQPTGKPMLSAKNVRDGFMSFADIDLIAPADFDNCMKRCAPKENDVLVVSVGATTGRAAIVGPCEPFSIVRSVLLLRPIIHSKFILRWVQSPKCQELIRLASGSTAQAHLYINDTRHLPIPIAPSVEIGSIVDEVDDQFSVIEHLQIDIESRLKRCSSFRQSILRHAFTGQLVPQDSKDEPASELLKRIAAEREARKKTKATPRKQTAKRQKREK